MGMPQTISAEILNMLIIVIILYIKIMLLYVSKAKSEITKRALAHHGAINWNTLPDYCKSALSFKCF